MKTKKQLKAKEPIKIRFKALSNGNKSIYLDTYNGGKRSYEFLKLYLVPEVDDASRVQNVNTMQVANAVKAQRMLDIANGKAGIHTASTRSKMLLSDWLLQYRAEQVQKERKVLYNVDAFIKVVEAYSPKGTLMKDIDKKFCLGLIAFIKHTYISPRTGKPLTKGSVSAYCERWTTILNSAVKAEVLAENPMRKIDASDKPKAQKSQREYLTIDEVKRLMETPLKREQVKMAYLFACCCGLRISDIRALTWGNIVRDGDQCRVEIRMQKTQEMLYLPLSSEAQRWMPERGTAKDSKKVFELPTLQTIEPMLRRWAEKAGISKHITFHTSRHTFATMLLTLGTDLYTASKLLGHSNVATTQIYAKIVNQKKVEAVNLFNNVFNH